MAEKKPGNGLWGWLGRQFGHVSKAMKADVTKQVVHRQEQVQEAQMPDQPEVMLRRTIIDEVIIDKKAMAKKPEGRR